MRTKKQTLRKQPTTRRFQNTASPYGSEVSVPRTARRRRRRNRPAVRNVLGLARWLLLSSRWISLLLFALSASVLTFIARDPSFRLNEIPVEGTRYLSPMEVLEASQLARIHVFAVDPEKAAQRVHDLPGVVSASVTLEWPNDVVIRIVEDTPIALWEQSGQRFWINSEGELIPVRREVPGLLLIQAEEPLTLTAEQTPDAPETQETEPEPAPFVPEDVLSGALLLKELRPNIESLYYRPSGGLSYQDGRGWRAYFGVGTDMAQKLAVYETLVEDLMTRQLTPDYISVSNKDKPYYMARGG
jgi:cell division septal protein FtsQ